MRTYDIISLGDTTIDVFLKLSDASVVCKIKKRECMLCIDYADKVPVEAFQNIAAVGNAANNAIGSSRLGLRSAIWTIVGSDDEGDKCVDVLKKEKVATPYVRRDRQRGTNFSTVLNFRSERTILVYHEDRTYRLPALPPARWAYLTSMGKGWEKIIPSLRRYLKRSGTRLAFNPGTHQMNSGKNVLTPLIAVTDVFIVNHDEAVRILKAPHKATVAELLRGFHALGAEIVVITEGPKGSHASDGSHHWFMPTFDIPAVERTGAGDSFSTGFLAALAKRKDVPEAMRWGTANGSSVIQYVGAREGLLTRSGMQRMLRRYRAVQPKERTL